MFIVLLEAQSLFTNSLGLVTQEIIVMLVSRQKPCIGPMTEEEKETRQSKA
jgi:hypothetical protein